MEHVPGGGDDYVVKAQGAVGENGLALLVKAYAYAHVVALIGGVGVLENDIAYAELLPAYLLAVFPLRPTWLSSSSFVSPCWRKHQATKPEQSRP